MARLPSGGRKRIPMKKIDSQSHLDVTFSKRRNGVYRKASELSRLCDCDAAVVIFTPEDNIYAFGEPSVEPILQTFMKHNPDEQNSVRENKIEDHQDAEWSAVDERILDTFMNQNSDDEKNSVAEHSMEDDDDDDDEWCELDEEEMKQYNATVEAEKARGKTIANELQNPWQDICSQKWWLAPVEYLTVDEAEKMLEKVEEFKISLKSQGVHRETSLSSQTNEVSFVGRFPFTPDPNLASTSGCTGIDKGKAPMQEY